MSEARFLLDSNILVYLVEGRTDHLRRRVELERPGAVVTSALCAAEVLFGLDDDASAARASFATLLAAIEPLPFDMAAARAFEHIPFRRGRLDRLIAAHALSRDLVVVTNNVADYRDIPGLMIENWTKP